MSQIRYANLNDIEFWVSLDKHISISKLKEKIDNKECLVILKGDKLIGILRYNYFWDNVPFVNMLYIKTEYQRNGYGKKLMLFFENEMKNNGYTEVMTSTQTDEEGKYFYAKLGYEKTGSLFLDNQAEELILIKKI